MGPFTGLPENVILNIPDSDEVFRVLFGDGKVKSLFKGHDQFNSIETHKMIFPNVHRVP